MASYLDIAKRHDFTFLFDVTNGNPNGDPDAGNLPRVDPETMNGLVTDVSTKRKIRDFMEARYLSAPGYRIFIQSKGIALNTLIRESAKGVRESAELSKGMPSEMLAALGADDETSEEENKEEGKKAKGKATVTPAQRRQIEGARRTWMCKEFFDIRTFGAVLSTGGKEESGGSKMRGAGQVRGPVQLTFARSVDPIVPLDVSITRVAITREEDDKNTEMGRKALVPYALYVGHGFITPHFAMQTGFSNQDLERFWDALQRCWELDRSASRGMLALRGLYVFSHENALGNAPAHQLFERIQIESAPQARRFADYHVAINPGPLPEGVTLTKLVG